MKKKSRNQLVVDELNSDRPHQSIYSRRFGFGQEVEGETLEGSIARGRITAVGEKTYRIEAGKMCFTVHQDTAKLLPFEETAEGKQKAFQGGAQ